MIDLAKRWEVSKLVVECRLHAIDAVQTYVDDDIRAKALAVFIEDVPIQLTDRRSARAGSWSPRKNLIRVNVSLHPNDDELRDTILHELAHAIVTWNGEEMPRDSHGVSWQTWMLRMGLKPERCHRYDVNEAHPGFYTIATCVKGHDVKLGPRQAPRARKRLETLGYTGFICRHCKSDGIKSPVIFKGE